jgi:DNA-binding NarL/FixJ family response regulator
MRVLLVGLPGERERLRAGLADGTYEVVAEFVSIAAARASGLEADAILMALRQQDHAAPVEPLTAREVEVLELLAEGRSNKAIAVRLGISDQTVKFHVAAICGKLGAANRTDAVQRAIRQGLITI